jgi:tetratricopeptide (TPR) repeat protein
MSPLVLAAFLAIQGSQPAPQDEIKDALARAESLYFEARFSDSVQLLSRVNDALKAQPERLAERTNTKLQLALANVGLNNPAAAKSFLMELFALDPDFNLDAQQFSPKIVALANDAKTEQNKIRCQMAGEDARRNLAAGDSDALMALLQSMKARCAELAAMEPVAADLVYKQGLNDYKQGDLASAVQNFRNAIKLAPKHEMAAQYLDLAENKLQVAQDRVLLDWQKSFDAQQFKQAGAIYRQVASFGNSAAKPLDHMTTEYRQVLIPLVEDVNRACSSNDAPKMDAVRNRISEILPEPSFGEDIRSRIVPCPPPEPPAPPKVVAVIEPRIEPPVVVKPAPKGCVPMPGALALARLKSRVEPEFPAAARTFFQNSQMMVTIKARIDESGNASVIDATGANVIITNSLRSAVEKWKFIPMVDESGPRCAITEFQMTLGK